VRPAWRAARNPLLEGAVALSALTVALIVYLPPLHGPLGTVSLAPELLVSTLALALVPAVVVEFAKWRLR
jgi:cation transport ATPase-like protein